MSTVRSAAEPLAMPLRVTFANPAVPEMTLNTVGDAAQYLESAFDHSYAKNVIWQRSAKALEAGQIDRSQIPQATTELTAFLLQEGRIMEAA